MTINICQCEIIIWEQENWLMNVYICVKRIMLCNCLFFFFLLLLFSQPCLGRRSCKSASLILKISQYGKPRLWVQLFPRYSCKNWYENWNLHFYKDCDHQIWQVSTSTIIFTIFWDFLMFCQIFLSPQVKRCVISTYKHELYSYEFPQDYRFREYDLTKLGNIRKVCKIHRMIAQCPVPVPIWQFC